MLSSQKLPLLLVLFALAVLLSTGCVHREYVPDTNAAYTPPTDEIEPFNYDRSPVLVKWRYRGTKEKYALYELRTYKRDLELVDKKVATSYLFVPLDRNVKHPALIILPPTGGNYEIMLSFGDYFAQR